MMQFSLKVLATIAVLTSFQMCAMDIEEKLPIAADVEISVRVPSFNEGRLKGLAEEHGYKFANLAELQILTDWLNRQGIVSLRVEVPQFFGIASRKIEGLLQESGFDVAAQWAAVVSVISEDARAEVMRTKQLPLEHPFWEAQKGFVARLEKAFDDAIPTLATRAFDAFATPPGKGQMGAVDLIDQTHESGDNFMVRSTGKEDTREMANAGGNESISNVSAENHALWLAIKEVVISYFGEKSLLQRLGLGDKTLFDATVFCPVLVQRMIGERSVDSIPVCGVMFTEEPEGGISWKNEVNEVGRVKTTGITLIQAAFGHNEGVVNSKVAIDTVIAQRLHGIDVPVFYPVVRAKRERLVPVEGQAKLMPAANPKHLILQPVLSSEILITLKSFSDALEQYYGYPIDVEFVVRDGVVYVVQARPIVHREGRAAPSYLSDLRDYIKSKTYPVFKGRTIGASGGALVTLLKKDDGIIVPTIGQALDIYLKSPVRGAVRAICVGEDAPATSHEATTFRSEGKPVVFVRDLLELEEHLTGGEKLIFSPLQHCVVAVSQSTSLPFLEGWCAYPLPPELSVSEVLLLGADRLPKLGEVDRAKLRGPKVELPELLEQMKIGIPEQVLLTVARLQAQLAAAIKEVCDHLKLDADLRRNIAEVQRAVDVVCRRVVLLSHIPQGDELYITRLLPILYLEALMFQQIRSQEVLNSLSIASLLNMLGQEAKAPASGLPESFGSEESSDYFMQLKKVEQILFEGHSSEMWGELIRAVARESDPLLSQSLASFVARLQDFDLLSVWLHTAMGREVNELLPALKSDRLRKKSLVSLIKGWVAPLRDAADFLDQITMLRKRMAGFQVNGFDDPKKFESVWAYFNENMLSVVHSDKFNADFTAANKTARLAACFMLNEFIDLFDRSIKAVKGSQNYKKEGEKVKRFKQMLVASNAFLRSILTLVPEGAIVYGYSNQDDFLNLIDVILLRDFTEDDLDATTGFNVSAFTIGSGLHLMDDERPETGEDVFTTLHQNLLVCVSALLKTNGGAEALRPPLLTQIEQQLIDAGTRALQSVLLDRVFSPTLVGCSITDQGIRLHYNLPLRNHSCQFFLDYKHKLKEVYWTVQFYGRWQNRWVSIVRFAALIDAVGLCSVQDYAILANGCSLTFVLKVGSNVAAVGRCVEAMIKSTYGDNLPEEELLSTTHVSWKKIFFAVKKVVGQKNLVHCFWLFDLALKEYNGSYKEIGNFAYARIERLKLFKELVAKGQAFLEATEIGKVAMVDEDVAVQKNALELFALLVAMDKGFEEAIEAAKTGIVSLDVFVRKAALELFKALLAKRQGVIDAIEVAKIAIVSNDGYVRYDAAGLFAELIALGRGLTQAVAAAKVCMASLDRVNEAKRLFEALARYANKSLAKARKGLLSASLEVKAAAVESLKQALTSFKELVLAKWSFAEAIQAAHIGSVSDDQAVRVDALLLFSELFAKKRGFTEAEAIIQVGIASGDRVKYDFAFVLLKRLVAVGKKIEMAMQIVGNENLTQGDAKELEALILTVKPGAFSPARVPIGAVPSTARAIRVSVAAASPVPPPVSPEKSVEEAFGEAWGLVRSSEVSQKLSGLARLKEMVVKGRYYEEALEAASECFVIDDVVIRSQIIGLIHAIVKKQSAYLQDSRVTALIGRLREIKNILPPFYKTVLEGLEGTIKKALKQRKTLGSAVAVSAGFTRRPLTMSAGED